MEPSGVESWNFQGLIISALSTTSEKMNKILEVRLLCPGWFVYSQLYIDINYIYNHFQIGLCETPFCWQLILIFLYLTSAWMFFFHSLATALRSSYHSKTQQRSMPTQPCSQCIFPNAEWLIGEESWSITLG